MKGYIYNRGFNFFTDYNFLYCSHIIIPILVIVLLRYELYYLEHLLKNMVLKI